MEEKVGGRFGEGGRKVGSGTILSPLVNTVIKPPSDSLNKQFNL